MEVGFISATQEIVDTTTTGGLAQLQMYAMFAEMDYNTIREQFQDGIQAKAVRGGWPGGEPPYSYRIEGKGKKGSFLVKDAREVRILKVMWRMVVRRAMNTREVAARLNATGIFTRSGKPWSAGNVRAKLVSDSTLKAVSVFRDPARTHAGHGARLTKDGAAKHGDTTELDTQISKLEQAITTTAVDYAKAGLPAVAVKAATQQLNEELGQLRTMRDEAAAWAQETEAAEQRASDLVALATRARERLADMTSAKQMEVLALLDVKVTITGEVPKPRVGLVCSMAEWFKAHGRLVPDELSDETWALAEPIFKAWDPPQPQVPARAHHARRDVLQGPHRLPLGTAPRAVRSLEGHPLPLQEVAQLRGLGPGHVCPARRWPAGVGPRPRTGIAHRGQG